MGERHLRHLVVVGEVDVPAVGTVVEWQGRLRAAAMTSPAMRAWYLPMWVSSARPQTSPMAYSQCPGTPSWTVRWSSTVIGTPDVG